jgi:hypothetical protein
MMPAVIPRHTRSPDLPWCPSYKAPEPLSNFPSFSLAQIAPDRRISSPELRVSVAFFHQFRRLQGTPPPDFCTSLLPMSWRISLTSFPLLFWSKSMTSTWPGGYRRLEPSVQALQTLGDAIELVEDTIGFPASRRTSSTSASPLGTPTLSLSINPGPPPARSTVCRRPPGTLGEDHPRSDLSRSF